MRRRMRFGWGFGTLLIALALSVVSVQAAATSPGKSGRLTHGLYVPTDMKCGDVTWDYDATNADYSPFIVNESNDSYGKYKKVSSPTSMTVEDKAAESSTAQYRLCPSGQLGSDVVRWSKSQEKRVTALPIKPGLYRVFDSNDGKPSKELCSGMSAYMLFEPTRFAHLETPESPHSGAQKTVIERIGKLRQVGPRVFFAVNGSAYPWLVKAPDRFERSMMECGNFEFRLVDPHNVPAGLIPRW